MRRRSASRAANAASPRSAAPRRSRPRPRPSAPASTCRGRRSRMTCEEPKRGAAFQKPMAVKLGVFRPVTVYPFYEAATSAHWGQTPREAMAESGELWSTYSDVASQNPNAWLKRRFTPDEITTPTPDNRLIAWPYTKLMVANPTVNMGARGPDDQPRQGARRRHRRGSPHSRLGRRLGGRAARLSDPRPVLRKPPAERRAQGGDGSRRRRRQGVRRDRAL